MKILTVVLFVTFLILAAIGFSLVISYKAPFENLNLELPNTTRFLIATYHYWFLLAFMPVGAYLLFKNNKKVLRYCLYSLITFAILYIPIILFLMYLPLFYVGDNTFG